MNVSFLNGWLFCAVLFLYSCNSAESESISEENVVSSSSLSNSVNKKADCLVTFNHDYSRLLTIDDVLKHVSIEDPQKMEVKYDEKSVQKNPEYGEIFYNWPSDRPDVQISPSFPLKQPDMNTISLTNLDFKEGSPAEIQERFHTSYKVMSQEEIDAGMERLEKYYKDKPAKQLESAKKLLKARGESKNKPVEGIGDYAYWFPVKVMNLYLGSKIVVLTGNAQFEVTAKLSENDEENLELAKKIALEVLAKCAG